MKDKIKSTIQDLFHPQEMFPGEKGTNGAGKKARDNESGIQYFSYRYNGSIGGNNHRYELTEKDGAVTFTFESMVYPDLGEARTEVNPQVLTRLKELYRELRLAEWDGYSKYNPLVLDGEGFALSIRFCDGGRLSADGTNAFPPRYGEFCDAMRAILDPLRDEILKARETDDPQSSEESR